MCVSDKSLWLLLCVRSRSRLYSMCEKFFNCLYLCSAQWCSYLRITHAHTLPPTLPSFATHPSDALFAVFCPACFISVVFLITGMIASTSMRTRSCRPRKKLLAHTILVTFMNGWDLHLVFCIVITLATNGSGLTASTHSSLLFCWAFAHMWLL